MTVKLEVSEAQLATVSQDNNEKNIEFDDVRTKLKDYKTRWESGSAIQSKLEADLNEMEARLLKSESEMGNQTLKMNKLLDVDTQMGTISTKLSDAQTKIFQIESERDEARTKLTDSEMKFKDHSAILKQLQDTELKLVSTEKKLHEVTEKSNNLSSKYSQSESKLDTYKADLLDAGSKIAVIQGMLSKSKDSSSSIGQNLDDKTNELKRLSIELSESELKLSRITSKLSDTEVTLQEKGLEIEDYTVRLSKVENSLADSRKEEETNAYKINNLLSTESKMETVSSELSDTQMKLKETQSRLSDAKLKIADFADDLSDKEDSLKAERDGLLNQLTKSKEKLEATEDNNSIQMVEYQKQLSELQVSLDQMEGQREDRIDSNKDIKEKSEVEVKQLQQKLTDSEGRISDLTKNLSDVNGKRKSDAEEANIYKKDYEKQLSELQVTLDMSRNSSKDLRKESEEKLKGFQSKLENSESQIKQLTTTLSDTETELNRVTTQTDDYKKQLSDVDTIYDSKEEIEKQMKQLENELADSESSVSKLTTKLSETEAKLEARLQDGLEKKLKEQKDNTVETEGYKKKIFDLQTALDSSNQENKQLVTLKGDLTEAQSNLSSLKAELADAETDLKKKDSQVDSYKIQLKDLESNVDSTRSELVEAKSALDKKPKIKKFMDSVPESSGTLSSATGSLSSTETSDISELDTQDEYQIEEIEGIGKGYGKQLKQFGITTTTEMLDKGSTVSEIKSIAKDMGKQEWVVRSWSSMADLTRIKGVGGQFAELIEFSGVHSVQSLKQQDAQQFTVTMKQVNDKEHRVKEAPDANAVKQWIGHAKTLPSVLDDDLEKIVQPSTLSSNTSSNISSEATSTTSSKLSDSEFSYEIEEIEGIGKGYGKQLNKLGIKTTIDLLAKGSNVSGVVSIAKDMDKQEWVVRSWSSMADLTRVEGVDGQFAELIEFSGVHSVQRLSQQDAKSFTVTMKQVNDKEHRVKEAPDTDTVSGWIKYAKNLAPILDDSLEKIVKSSKAPSEDETVEDETAKTASKDASNSNYTDASYEIEEIEGIGKGYGKQLSKIGIRTTADLLKKYQADSSLSSVVGAMKQEKWVVQSWVSMADLLRIDGVDGQFAELLYFSGIHSVQQLALFNPSNLARKMERTNEEQHRVKTTPNVSTVIKWISLAKTLNKVVIF